MLSNMLYDPNDNELSYLRNRAKNLCLDYNQSKYGDEKRENILRELIPNSGNIEINSPFYCDYGINIEMGNNVFANYNLVILDCARVKIGNNVFIGPNVSIYTAIHPIDSLTRNKGLEIAKEVIIEDDVWIGGNVVIMPGVTIGEGSVIGAGSIVTKSIDSNSKAWGNPCLVKDKIN